MKVASKARVPRADKKTALSPLELVRGFLSLASLILEQLHARTKRIPAVPRATQLSCRLRMPLAYLGHAHGARLTHAASAAQRKRRAAAIESARWLRLALALASMGA